MKILMIFLLLVALIIGTNPSFNKGYVCDGDFCAHDYSALSKLRFIEEAKKGRDDE